jgi:hypothetical protein
MTNTRQIDLTRVTTEDRDLEVSTIRITGNRYDTVVFDRSPDSRHRGWLLGTWRIDDSSEWTTSEEAARIMHREAVQDAYYLPLRPAGYRHP